MRCGVGALALMSDIFESEERRSPFVLRLRTERLLLRPITAEDADVMVSNLGRLEIA